MMMVSQSAIVSTRSELNRISMKIKRRRKLSSPLYSFIKFILYAMYIPLPLQCREGVFFVMEGDGVLCGFMWILGVIDIVEYFDFY